MSYHLIETIFINLPITVAYQRLWQLLLSADELQAFNHYFKTNTITNKKGNLFERQILLRLPQKLQTHTTITINQDIPLNSIKITQKVTKIQSQKKILYETIKSQQKQQIISGDFFHQFQQNNKGQVYLIFASSCRKGAKSFPQKSQVQIQLIKIKDLIENQGAKFDKDKSFFKKCC